MNALLLNLHQFLDGSRRVEIMIKVIKFDVTVNFNQFNFNLLVYMLNKRRNILRMILIFKNNIIIIIIII